MDKNYQLQHDNDQFNTDQKLIVNVASNGQMEFNGHEPNQCKVIGVLEINCAIVNIVGNYWCNSTNCYYSQKISHIGNTTITSLHTSNERVLTWTGYSGLPQKQKKVTNLQRDSLTLLVHTTV